MIKKTLLIVLGCIVSLACSQSSVTDIINAKRRQAGIYKKLELDTILTSGCKIGSNASKGLAKSQPNIDEIRKFLWNKHNYDAEIQIVFVEGADAAQAIDNSTQKDSNLDKILTDSGYNRIGVYEEPRATGKKMKIIATKHLIEFDPLFKGEINQYGSGRVEHVLKITGTSYVGGLEYGEGIFQSIDDRGVGVSKKVQFGLGNKFEIPVQVQSEVQQAQWGGVQIFDAHKKLVAFVKL